MKIQELTKVPNETNPTLPSFHLADWSGRYLRTHPLYVGLHTKTYRISKIESELVFQPLILEKIKDFMCVDLSTYISELTQYVKGLLHTQDLLNISYFEVFFHV